MKKLKFKFFRGLVVRTTRRYNDRRRNDRTNEIGSTTQPVELTLFFVQLMRSTNIRNLQRWLGAYHGFQRRILVNRIKELDPTITIEN